MVPEQFSLPPLLWECSLMVGCRRWRWPWWRRWWGRRWAQSQTRPWRYFWTGANLLPSLNAATQLPQQSPPESKSHRSFPSNPLRMVNYIQEHGWSSSKHCFVRGGLQQTVSSRVWDHLTLQCVVETGRPMLEATTTVRAEASSMLKPLQEN